MNERFFSVDISDPYNIELLFHQTLEQAKKQCLDDAEFCYTETIAWDDGSINDDNYPISKAVYGIIMGRAVSDKRSMNEEEIESGRYEEDTEIIEAPHIEELPQFGQWISVKDSLPPLNKKVLIMYCGDIKIAVRVHTLDGDWNWVGDDENIFKKWLVTHWMPLPALPALPVED